jgi:hypothetical protein
MADQIRILDRLIQTKPFDLRALLRLATWGCVAATALMLAVLSANMGTKHQALAPSTTALQVPAATVQLTTRQTEPDKATHQLSEAVSGLAADRDRLVARIASLERNLEDVTGSIKQQAAAPPASVSAQTSMHAPTTAPAPAFVPAQASTPAQASVPMPASGPAPRSMPALAPTATAPSATPSSPAPPAPRSQAQPEKEKVTPTATAPLAATPTPPPGAIAASPSAPAAPPAAAPPPTRVANLPEASDPEGKSRMVDFGLDIGGATTFDGLRALWNSVRNNTADLFEDLHPMVAVRENKSRGVDLRLVVGPIASSEAATQMCATLLAARRFCQMTIFEGQPLPQSSSVTEGEPRRTPAAPTRPTSQSKAVRPPAPRQ